MLMRNSITVMIALLMISTKYVLSHPASATVATITTTTTKFETATTPAVLTSKEGPESNNVTQRAPCDQNISLKHLFLAVFSTLVLIIGVTGNLLTIIVIFTSRQLRKHNTYLLLASLGVADLGVSLFVTTGKVDMYLRNGSFCHDKYMCVFFLLTDSIFPIASITNIFVIAVDRWYAINHPYDYIAVFTPRRARFDSYPPLTSW